MGTQHPASPAAPSAVQYVLSSPPSCASLPPGLLSLSGTCRFIRWQLWPRDVSFSFSLARVDAGRGSHRQKQTALHTLQNQRKSSKLSKSHMTTEVQGPFKKAGKLIQHWLYKGKKGPFPGNSNLTILLPIALENLVGLATLPSP